MKTNISADVYLPAWLPEAVRLYLHHTEDGLSLRALARRKGCAASTVMRQVRRYENRRDDPLVDEALAALGRARAQCALVSPAEDIATVSAPIRAEHLMIDNATIAREARRILRRLSEPGAVLAIAADMEKAAVLRALPGGRTERTGVVERTLAQAFALKDWISCTKPGRVASYEITAPGRAALKRFMEVEPRGMAEAQTPFANQHRDWDEREIEDEDGPRRQRYNLAESPVALLGRRRDKDGKPFLEAELVDAAERLREDFELAQMGPRVAQNWDRFLTGGDRGGFRGDAGMAEGPRAARDRVARALRDLGPGLGDMVLRCCCFLEGLEAAEKRMGWSARSGKIVLRIALQRLKRHYDEAYGRSGPLIG
ncbi:MAG: helix-turn-helix domain containing protein [Cereibacter sphaeroides]|uniref:Helix-turn-helix domain containing protein n=1 Tax=Cereibacter sphaeroides TaxID=1063 RepID=A0A2W5S9E2_CERSP|nr:MAG: helix-turn-helix domain containing protein [Cereibacter sphaeroides]